MCVDITLGYDENGSRYEDASSPIRTRPLLFEEDIVIRLIVEEYFQDNYLEQRYEEIKCKDASLPLRTRPLCLMVVLMIHVCGDKFETMIWAVYVVKTHPL